MKKIADYIASLGQSMQFVAFMAHCFVAAWIVMILPGWSVLALLAFAAVKEFVFDARYETNPPQTFYDNAEDFIGYLAGVALGMVSNWLTCRW